ncbi:MAG: hypothetical protein JJ879_10195 [Sneathiella sp.]|nr:hypothetical protein [Sneathiella sp.]
MENLPDMLKYGEKARLFPTINESNKERRIASAFLAVFSQVPEFSKILFKSLGVTQHKRFSVEVYTEVVFHSDQDSKDRPDGLIILRQGQQQWSALIEAKIGNASLEVSQVERYLELAKVNKIDAVITLSNQFVPRPSISPLSVNRRLLRNVDLFHWSWGWVSTKCKLLEIENLIDDEERTYILREFNRFVDHPSTGMTAFTQMGPGWRELVRDVAAGAIPQRTSPVVENALGSWFEEQSDISLLISRHIGKPAKLILPKSHEEDMNNWFREAGDLLISEKRLEAQYRIDDVAGDIVVESYLARKSLSVLMRVTAPKDKQSTKARLNWLLRMLKEDDERLSIRAIWPGRAQDTQVKLAELRLDPDKIQCENKKLVPNHFEVLLVEVPGQRFSGAKTFIEDLERVVIEFYDLVGQSLRPWQPKPPKPVRETEMEEPVS